MDWLVPVTSFQLTVASRRYLYALPLTPLPLTPDHGHQPTGVIAEAVLVAIGAQLRPRALGNCAAVRRRNVRRLLGQWRHPHVVQDLSARARRCPPRIPSRQSAACRRDCRGRAARQPPARWHCRRRQAFRRRARPPASPSTSCAWFHLRRYVQVRGAGDAVATHLSCAGPTGSAIRTGPQTDRPSSRSVQLFARRAAVRNTDASMGGVSTPVFVFWRLG